MTREEAYLGMTYVDKIESIKEELGLMKKLYGVWNGHRAKPRLVLQLETQGNPAVAIESEETIEQILDIANSALENTLNFYEEELAKL